MSTDAEAVLRDAGHRVTRQRASVLQAVMDLGHATPEQISERVADVADLSTVYRTLDLLEETGLLQHTHLGHGSPTWSLAQDHAHVHLVCARCGAVLEVEIDTVEPVVTALRDRYGFSVDLGHLSLSGECRHCGTKRAETH